MERELIGVAVVKSPWVILGIGTAMALVGGLMWVTSAKYGQFIFLMGLVIAVIGIAIRIALAYMGKSSA